MEQGEHISNGVRICNFILGGVPYLRGEYHKWSFGVRYFVVALLVVGASSFWFILPIIIGIFVATKMQLGKHSVGKKAVLLGTLVLLIQLGYSLSLMPAKLSVTNATSSSQVAPAKTNSVAEAEAAKFKQAEEAKRLADEAARAAAVQAEQARVAEVARVQQEQQAQANAKAAAEAEAARVAQQQVAKSNCHPSYDPCIPNGADMDCPEVRALVGSVHVIGYDSYRLDRDKDGIGCE